STLHSHNAIVPPRLGDLAVKTCCSENAPGNWPIEFESVGGNQRDTVEIHSARNISKQANGISVASFPDDGRRPKSRPHVDGDKDPARGLFFSADHRTNLIDLQLPNDNLRNRLIVESTARLGCSLQPTINCVPGNLFDSRNGRFIDSFDAETGDLVKGFAAVMESVINSPAVPAKRLSATFTSKSATPSPPSLVGTITNDRSERGICSQRTLLVWTSEALHGIWTRSTADLLTSRLCLNSCNVI